MRTQPEPSDESPRLCGEPGSKSAARAYDAMIAAVAVANDLPLYTCNPDDFTGIDGLRVVAVPHPDQ
jgi:tRNA(fMet)-specific endonuclease VapC